MTYTKACVSPKHGWDEDSSRNSFKIDLGADFEGSNKLKKVKDK